MQESRGKKTILAWGKHEEVQDEMQQGQEAADCKSGCSLSHGIGPFCRFVTEHRRFRYLILLFVCHIADSIIEGLCFTEDGPIKSIGPLQP